MAVKMAERARRADFSLSSGLSSTLRFASLCSFFCGGGVPARHLLLTRRWQQGWAVGGGSSKATERV